MNTNTYSPSRETPSPTPWISSRNLNNTLVENVGNLSVDVQLKHMTNESQRKDLLILDLRKQVSELLRFREQASHLRAQVTLVEEREKLREAEANTKNTELITRVRALEDLEATLRSQVIRLEEDKSEILRRANHQNSDVQAQLAALRADAERREIVRHKLEYELTLASKAIQQHQDREKAERALVEQLGSINTEKGELERANTRMSETNARLESEIRTIGTIYEKEKLKSENLEFELDSLRGTVKVQEAELKARRQDTGTIAGLQQELQIIPSLKGDIVRLNHALKDAEDKSRLLEDEKIRMAEAISNLQHQLNDYSRRTVDLISLTAQVQDYKSKVELLDSELERSRSLAEKLRDQLSKTRTRLDSTHSELHKVVSTVRDYFGVSAPRDEGSRGEFMDVLWGELRSLVTRLCAENSLLEPARGTARHYEDVNKHLDSVNSSLEKERLSLLSSIAKLEAESNSHKTFMQTLCKDISTNNTLYNNNPQSSALWNVNSSNTQTEPSISMMHVFLSERLAKLSSLNETYHKSLEEKSQALAEKTKEAAEKAKEVAELQQKLTQNTQQERNKSSEQIHTMEQKLQTSQAEMKGILESTETDLMQTKESLHVAEQAALNIEARYKESLLRITSQTEEVETLYYAVEVLVRVLRPLRVRYCEVVSQKRFLHNLLRDSQTIREGVHVLAQALAGQLDESALVYAPPTGRRRKLASMRVAGIFVIAFNRFAKITSHPGYRPLSGSPFRIGRENFALAPQVIVSHVSEIPNITIGEDIPALISLINHFDPPSRFEDAILDPRLLFALQSGLPRRIRGKGAVMTTRGMDTEESLAVVRKTTLEIMRRLKEAESEKNQLLVQAGQLSHELGQLKTDHASMDLALAHSQELCAILEDRVHHLQEEEVEAQNIRAEELRASLKEQAARVADLSSSLLQLKIETRSKESHVSDLQSDLFARDALIESLRMDLESKDALLDTFKREMNAKDILLSDLKDEVRSKSALLSDLRTRDVLNNKDRRSTKR